MKQKPDRPQLGARWRTFVTFLTQTDLPVWLTLLLITVGAVGTYLVAPHLNERFEQQKIRSSYIVKNLNEFNLSTRNLVSKISNITNSMIDGEKPSKEKINEIRSKITELQWRALELDIIFDDSYSISIVSDYKKSLGQVRKSLNNVQNQENPELIIEKTTEFGIQSTNVIRLLAKKANININ